MKIGKNNNNPIIETIAIAAGLYFVGTFIYSKIKGASGIGKVERIKRRIYKEVSLAQEAGVDFTKKYAELSNAELDALEHIGKDVVMWKQSKRAIENGKPYTESYYGSLRRAWNAVSGCEGIGRAYDVKDANGNVVLTWTDVTEHVQHEPDAKVLLALPPHVEEKKKKAKKNLSKAELEEYKDREIFAIEFLNNFEKEYEKEWKSKPEFLYKKLFKQHYHGEWDINDVPDNIFDGLVVSFARNQLKVNSKSIWFCGEKFSKAGGAGIIAHVVEDLLKAWDEHNIDSGFSRNDLDAIRRELLDRAQHMFVVFKDKDGRMHMEKGDDRYKYLDKINWVIMVRDTYRNTAAETTETTIYPVMAFETEKEAKEYGYSKWGSNGGFSIRSSRSYKIIPIFDVDLNSISGIAQTW